MTTFIDIESGNAVEVKYNYTSYDESCFYKAKDIIDIIFKILVIFLLVYIAYTITPNQTTAYTYTPIKYYNIDTNYNSTNFINDLNNLNNQTDGNDISLQSTTDFSKMTPEQIQMLILRQVFMNRYLIQQSVYSLSSYMKLSIDILQQGIVDILNFLLQFKIRVEELLA